MINYLFSLLFGVVQGLTEFLPISSSGHLLFFHELLNFNLIDSLSFDTALHLGTLLALLIFFRQDIIKYLRGFFRSFVQFNPKKDEEQRIGWLIVLSTLPAGLAGLFLENIIETLLRNLWVVAITLIGVGILFILFEKLAQQTAEIENLNWWQVLIIGVAQALALVPGVSRSGITIIAGMGLKLKRAVAARFSFVLSAPIVLAAGLKKVYDLGQVGMNNEQVLVFLVGLVSSAVIGYLAIKFLLKFLANHSLNYFAVYRILLGLVIIIWLLVIN